MGQAAEYVTREEFEPMREDIQDLRSRMVDVEHRLDKVEQRLDKVEQRLDKVEQRLDSVEQRLLKVEIRLEVLSEQVHRNTVQLAEMREDFNEFRDYVEARFDRLEKTVVDGQAALMNAILSLRSA